YDGPSISPPVVENAREATKDTVIPTNNGNTKDVQPQGVSSKPPVLTSEPANTPQKECNSSKNHCSKSGNEYRSSDNESSTAGNDADADIGP
nr:hypothetical protein [Tanacetum cinerariifolium]